MGKKKIHKYSRIMLEMSYALQNYGCCNSPHMCGRINKYFR